MEHLPSDINHDFYWALGDVIASAPIAERTKLYSIMGSLGMLEPVHSNPSIISVIQDALREDNN